VYLVYKVYSWYKEALESGRNNVVQGVAKKPLYRGDHVESYSVVNQALITLNPHVGKHFTFLCRALV
jgi:hypothetical protein